MCKSIKFLEKFFKTKTNCGLPKKTKTYSLIVHASRGTGEINGRLSAMLCQTDEEGEE
jgi:hypothetical protein